MNNISPVIKSVANLGNLEGAKAAASVACSSLSVVCKVAFKAFQVYALYSQYEAAFSDILCLKTFRHGTDPYAATRIHLEGPDHSRAGTGGESRGILATTGQYSDWHRFLGVRKEFFVVEDYLGESTESRVASCFNYIGSRATVKHYSLLATTGWASSALPLPRSIKPKVTNFIYQTVKNEPRLAIFGLLTPTVKFHLNPKKVAIREWRDESEEEGIISFQRDGEPAKKGGCFQGALRTKHQFSVLDIGILGIVKNGINKDIFKRINENRGQFVWGLAQLVGAVALTALFFPTIVPGGAMIAGGIFASCRAIHAIGAYPVIGEIAAGILFIPYFGVSVLAASQL